MRTWNSHYVVDTKPNPNGLFVQDLHPVSILDFWGPTQNGGGGVWGCVLACVVEMKEWMQRICLCFTLCRIVLVENAHLFRCSVRFLLFIFLSKRLNDIHVTWFDWFYVERVTAHRIKLMIIHVFITSGQTLKRNLNENIFGSKGFPGVSGDLRSLRNLHIGRIACLHLLH